MEQLINTPLKFDIRFLQSVTVKGYMGGAVVGYNPGYKAGDTKPSCNP